MTGKAERPSSDCWSATDRSSLGAGPQPTWHRRSPWQDCPDESPPETAPPWRPPSSTSTRRSSPGRRWPRSASTFYRGGLISRATVLRALVVAARLPAPRGERAEAGADPRVGPATDARAGTRPRCRELVREALDEVVEPIIYAEALDLIEQHQAAGRKTTSSRPRRRRSCGPLAEYLGRGRGHRQPGGGGRSTAATPGRWPSTPTARSRPRPCATWPTFEGIDLAASYAYSDSYTDVPMLEAVGHPVVVNPDRVLARLARERDWEIRRSPGPCGCATGYLCPTSRGGRRRRGDRPCRGGCWQALHHGAAVLGRGGTASGAAPRPAEGRSGFAEPLGGDEDPRATRMARNQQFLHGRRSYHVVVDSPDPDPSDQGTRADAPDGRLRR